MRRFKVHPYGTAARPTRLLSLLLVIAVLWMLFDRPARTDPSLILWVMVVGVVATGVAVWMRLRKRRVVRNRSLPTDAELDSLAIPFITDAGARAANAL